MEKEKFPIGADHYSLYEEVGTGASSSVHRALCKPLNEVVAVKILDFERSNVDLSNISREAQTMVLVDHPNVLKSHCSFVNNHSLWVVMPYMSGGSCLHILKATHPDGFEEAVIATILREVLKGLDYLHERGHIHRDVKAGNVLIDKRGGVKLGDFGVSAYLFDSGDRQRMRNTFVGTPCWMAPEVMEKLHGYDFKADIWSFGITALELAHGHAPFSTYPPMKVLLMTLQNEPPGLDYERDKKFKKSFKQMIASCLVKDPSKRPSAKKLLKHSFFKQAKSNDYITRTLLEGLPTLGDVLQTLKKKEEDMLAQKKNARWRERRDITEKGGRHACTEKKCQMERKKRYHRKRRKTCLHRKKMPDGEKEEISQNEYRRGISGWNFDLDDMKAQASLIQDDDVFVEKDEDMPEKSPMSKNVSLLLHQLSFASRSSDTTTDSDDNAHASASPVDPTSKIAKYEKLGDNVSGLASTIEQPAHKPLSNDSQAEKPMSKVNGISSDGVSPSSNECEKVKNQSHDSSCNGAANSHTLDNSKPVTGGSKISVNGEENDEKTKNPVVQQKGRFKITSENAETEKVAQSPLIPKSQSLQVIVQHPALLSPLASEATTTPNPLRELYPTLQSVLQTNISQRDLMLKLMKQVAVGDSSGCTPMNSEVAEIPLLEAAHEREKELLYKITDLQLRLISAQEELQKYKS